MRIRQSLLAVGALLAAAGASRADTYTYAENGNNIVQYIVPTSGTYDITAIGAAGGNNVATGQGGAGASVNGSFSLTSGEILDILVGQQGFENLGGGGGGGGGGTFVVLSGSPDTPLLIAGGGGGASFVDNGQGAGSLSLQDGGGGGGGAAPAGPGGGGGFSGDGTSSAVQGGKSFTDGGAGGAGFGFSNGGFGGGGGAFSGGGGGGGGYTGGDGGNGSGGYAGSSYYNPAYLFGATPSISSAGSLADGSVTITFVPAMVPTPAAAEAGGLLLAAMGLMKYRARKKPLM